MSILNGFKTFERYLKTPNGYQLYSERQLAKDVLMGDGNDENNNIENTVGQLSNPNLLINGDFQVWQRGTEINTYVSTAFRYNADRWCHYTSVESRLIKKVDNGIYTEANLFQILEKKLEAGKPYVLSASINDVVYKLDIIGNTASDITLGDFTLRYFTGMKRDRIGVINNQTYAITVNWVKLEQGTIATPFVPRPYTEEFMLCRRYYKVTGLHDCVGYSGSAKTVYVPVPQIMDMRDVISITYDFTTVGVYAYNVYETRNVTNVYKAYECELGFVLDVNPAPNQPVNLCISSDKKLVLDAEIYTTD